MHLPYVIQAGQHPDEVARACVRMARKWARRPETVLITRSELSPLAPRARDPRGSWVAEALFTWSRGLVFFREPAGLAYAGELVQSLPLTILLGGGDCDDIATAQATMASCLGIPAAVGRLMVGANAHVFCAVGSSWYGPVRQLAWVIDPELEAPEPAGTKEGTRWFYV